MPVSSAVEYNANSKSSNVVIKNDPHQTANGSQESPKATCNKGTLPVRFDRASSRWWDYRLDSDVLEDQFKITSSPQFQSLFRHSLVFASISGIAWAIYIAAATRLTEMRWVAGITWSLVLALLSLVLLICSNREKLYRRFSLYLNATFLLLIVVTALVSAYYVSNVITVVGSFFIVSTTILLIYLILPLPVPISCAVAVIVSILFEILLQLGPIYQQEVVGNLGGNIVSHIFLLVCVNVVGCMMLLDLMIMRHSTFLKICRGTQATQAKCREEKFKHLMVKSVMPVSVAEKLMLRNDEGGRKNFRPFTMSRMDNVSILYADIVGFTQMSSNKSAEQLVGLLNDLFGRFDVLCEVTGCEKISTLGDCYYCVAGCPEERKDHASCCVEMGLGMVSEIKDFCKRKDINVNMRVGIHTGYVLCGVVGTRRYKFDVWSNDVTLANGMEQHGIPGRVHISQATLNCLDDDYIVEDSKLEERDKEFLQKTGNTYLVVGRKDLAAGPSNNVKKNGSGLQPTNNSLPPSSGQPQPPAEDSEATGTNSSSHVDQLSQLLVQHLTPVFLTGDSLFKLRKREDDTRFTNSVKKDPLMVTSYQNKEVNAFTLQFKLIETEEMYRNLFSQEIRKDGAIEFRISPRFRLFKDVLLSTFLTLLLFISSILLLQSPLSPSWIVVFIVLFLIQIASSVTGSWYVFHKNDLEGSGLLRWISSFTTWYWRHLTGAIFLLIPAAVVFSHVSTRPSAPSCSSYSLLLLISLLQFFNFNQLSTWARSILSAVVAVGSLLLVYVVTCAGQQASCVCTENPISFEYILDFVLMLAFLWYINRHFELGYRLDFISEKMIISKLDETQQEKDKVEQLIHNFIPPHVQAELEKNKDKRKLYSKTHKKVGVIFGTIVNFNELYEESFEGGKEFLRFLSELISDVDDLLSIEKYKDIEKIKTIGTTFMLASGLNPDVDQESNGIDSHLHRLMDFCIEMQNVVDNFNKNMLNFQLVLRIGFNHGVVTAGVIGSTKRLYDIWGDTVNIASRMDSTGVPGKVQVSEESKAVLENHFKFSYSGEKFVKGKGKMRTYLLVREDEAQRPKITPNPTFDYPPFT